MSELNSGPEETPLPKRLRGWTTAALQNGGMARIPWRILESMANQAEALSENPDNHQMSGKPDHWINPYADAGPWNRKSLQGRWTRLCWWLSRLLGGRSVFGKADLSGR